MIFVGFDSKNAHLKIPISFLFLFWLISKQTADKWKNVYPYKMIIHEWEKFRSKQIFEIFTGLAIIWAEAFCKQTAENSWNGISAEWAGPSEQIPWIIWKNIKHFFRNIKKHCGRSIISFVFPNEQIKPMKPFLGP